MGEVTFFELLMYSHHNMFLQIHSVGYFYGLLLNAVLELFVFLPFKLLTG